MDDFTNNTTSVNTMSRVDSSGVDSSDASAGRHLRAVASTTSPAGWSGADLSDDALSDRVAGLAGRISAATCEWLGYVAEADRRGVWSGFASCAAWLSWRCGLGLGTAADQVRVARGLVDLPVIRSHFASGSLSYSQVRALIRGAGLIPEDELVELARHATGAQLERLVRALRRATTDEDEQAAAGRQRAQWHVDDDGSLVISARLSGEWAEAWLAALEQAQAQARAQTGGPVTQAAVMATVAGRALSAPGRRRCPDTHGGDHRRPRRPHRGYRTDRTGRHQPHRCFRGKCAAMFPRKVCDVSAESAGVSAESAADVSAESGGMFPRKVWAVFPRKVPPVRLAHRSTGKPPGPRHRSSPWPP